MPHEDPRRPPIDDAPATIFSYGTLQQPDVQRAVFGELLPSSPDAIAGYRLDWITISDPDVIRVSGSDRHPMLRPDATGATVSGTAFSVTADQVRRADAYEVDDYARIDVTLVSGRQAWVYAYLPLHTGRGAVR